VLAGLVASGKTEVLRVHLDRGYESIEKKPGSRREDRRG
jgi:UDP-N-acetylglucosamine enolpyruvyl transferase